MTTTARFSILTNSATQAAIFSWPPSHLFIIRRSFSSSLSCLLPLAFVVSVSESPFNSVIGSSSFSAFVVVFDDDTDYACSICLEPFTLQDPSTVTSCKHEYHLQCIIEWSQRSKECPICWQLFVLKDPASQELLSAVEKERLLKTRTISSSSPISIHHSHEDFHSREEESQFTSFDEQFLRHLTEAAHRRCLLRRIENQISSSLVSSNDPSMMANLDIVTAYGRDYMLAHHISS